ncbi:aminopeptidase P family protein [Microbacterium sp. NPDC058342]|uniref:aminopeptidase P family protein n=1 Tax=Microbacterium sp. NPDC058342 TaxID=3346454 RepID=UPI0036545BF8
MMTPADTTTAQTGPARPLHSGVRPPRLTASPGFVEHIGTGWGEMRTETGVQPEAAAAALRHRERLSAAFPGRTLVVASGSAPVRNDDCSYEFRADSAFVWLTSCQAENAVLVLHPRFGGHDATLYLPPPFRPGEDGFFDDSDHGELWVGPQPGLAEWQNDLGIDVRPRGELSSRSWERALGSAAAVRAGLDAQPSDDFDRVLSTLRMVKDEWEIAQLRQAVDATTEGFAAVAAEFANAVRPGLGERWLQGTFDRHARTFGNGPGYSTIVGSGAHAPVLHWSRCDGPLDPSASVLLDMGVEARTLYTADVTRALPVGGTFTDAERTVHDLVERAHRAALAAVGPGALFSDFHHASMQVLAQGLHDWGLLPVSVDEALSPEGQHHRRFICCSVGHHLGLDVHDCSRAHASDYSMGELAPDMVIAVEPGLYFHANDLTVPPELRGVGMRIEDDVLVTPDGNEVLSRALPIDARGLEAWVRAQSVDNSGR